MSVKRPNLVVYSSSKANIPKRILTGVITRANGVRSDSKKQGDSEVSKWQNYSPVAAVSQK